MKLKSKEKLDVLQFRLKLDERLTAMIKQYVVYANTHLGHHFADEKELAVEVFRAFLDGDRGFKQWLAKQNEPNHVLVSAPIKSNKKALDSPAFENGLSAK